MRHQLLLATSLLSLLSVPVFAAEGKDAARAPVIPRGEVNWRYGDERSILMSEFWTPLIQGGGLYSPYVLWGDLRMMGDDADNREGNLGIGYRQMVNLPVAGTGVAGVHGWFDRRLTERGSSFHQLTGGVEWLGEVIDIRANGYVPLSTEKTYTIPNANPQAPALAGTGIVVDTNGTLIEESQPGFDIEFGIELGALIDPVRTYTDSTRIYAGGYYFEGDYSEKVAGWRTRIAADITPDIQIGGRLQHDAARGGQAFIEATIRFPFKAKKSYRQEGLYARLDESPERDIDIVTGSAVTDTGDRVPVVNTQTGQAVEVLTVDNTAAAGGDGSAERPYNTLLDAQNAAAENTIIYLKAGDGTTTNQDQGLILNKTGQRLIGSGTDFYLDLRSYAAANGGIPTSLLIAQASTAPVITNTNVDGDGITVNADNIGIAGVTVDGANRDGILIEADGAAASAQNIAIEDVSAINNRMGLYIHGTNSGSVSAKVESTVTAGNSQHGMAVYDDTDGTFEVDLGGGDQGSTGHNVLAGNTLEDLAVDYDGRTLAAMNNWWGQASGADEDDPGDGTDPQIYYGAPINDGLVGHWTFDAAWTTDTTAYDRSGNDNDGTLQGGLSLADMVQGQNGEALEFDGSEYVDIPASASLNVLGTNYSVFSWTRISSTPVESYNTVYSSGSVDGLGSYWQFILDDSTQKLAIRKDNSGSAVVGSGIYTPDEWQYTGVTKSGDTGVNANFYIDNASAGSISVGAMSSNGIKSIGRRLEGNNHYYTGLLDDIRIYDRALTASEIAELYRMDTTSIVDTSSFLTSAP